MVVFVIGNHRDGNIYTHFKCKLPGRKRQNMRLVGHPIPLSNSMCRYFVTTVTSKHSFPLLGNLTL